MKISLIAGAAMLIILGCLWRAFPHALDSNDSIGDLVKGLVIFCVLIPSLLTRTHFSQILYYGKYWAGIFLVLLVGFCYHEEAGNLWTRIKSNIIPSQAVENDDGSFSVLRANDGHFHIQMLVNDVPMQFMVDTGASRVVLSVNDARKLGFAEHTLSFNQPVQTANGKTFTASVYIAEFKIGAFSVKGLNASVGKNLEGESLLGMNFLKRLKSFQIQGDRMTLWMPDF